jgi:hypothetical protein
MMRGSEDEEDRERSFMCAVPSLRRAQRQYSGNGKQKQSDKLRSA